MTRRSLAARTDPSTRLGLDKLKCLRSKYHPEHVRMLGVTFTGCQVGRGNQTRVEPLFQDRPDHHFFDNLTLRSILPPTAVVGGILISRRFNPSICRSSFSGGGSNEITEISIFGCERFSRRRRKSRQVIEAHGSPPRRRQN